MSINHHAELGDVLYLVRDGLAPFVIRRYKETYGTAFEDDIKDILLSDSYSLPETHGDESLLLQSLDIYSTLKLIRKRWYIFQTTFGSRDDIDQLFECRTRWGHQKPVTNEEASEGAEAASRVLETIGETTKALRARTIGEKLREQLAIQQRAEFSESITKIHQAIERLTEDQCKVIKELSGKRRVSIGGCAGSGKTLVAVEKAIRLDAAGIPTLLLCHSPKLATYLSKLTENTGVCTFDFTRWVNSILNNIENSDDIWTHYEEPTDEELSVAFDKLFESKQKYSAIIVDEGQDFREEWWILIEAAFTDPQSGILYIFHDDNQALLPFRSKYPIQESVTTLSKNCRNANSIYEVIRRFHIQTPEPSLSLQGGIVKEYFFDDADQSDTVRESLEDMMRDGLNPDQIRVLTTELVNAEQSILNGLEIKPSDWTWQSIVSATLSIAFYSAPRQPKKAHPHTSPKLSSGIYPSVNDIENVCDCARRLYTNLYHVHPGLVPKLERPVRWVIKQGRPVVETLEGRNPGPFIILEFLADPHWANTLPKPQPHHSIVLNKKPSIDQDNRSWIPLFNVFSFKGLEADGVILVVQSARQDLSKTLYVGVSRARFALSIVANKTVAQEIPQINISHH